MFRPAAYVCLALPFVFGIVRAAQTGTDVRYLATALTSFGAVISVIGRVGPAALLVSRLLLALIVGTIAGVAMAFALGARSIPAMSVVAFAFATCQVLGWAGLRWTR